MAPRSAIWHQGHWQGWVRELSNADAAESDATSPKIGEEKRGKGKENQQQHEAVDGGENKNKGKEKEGQKKKEKQRAEATPRSTVLGKRPTGKRNDDHTDHSDDDNDSDYPGPATRASKKACARGTPRRK